MAESFYALVGIAVILFAGTHIDDLFVLMGFFSDRRFRAWHVVVGQCLGISVIFAVSVVASLLAFVISPVYVGLLGLAPICLGIAKLYSLWRGAPGLHNGDARRTLADARAGKNMLAVTIATVANSGDNISVYTPLFATHSAVQVTVVGLVFALMTAFWCVLGHTLVHHPALGGPLRRYGHVTLPFLLIGFGIYILYEAGTFTLI